MDPTEKKPKIFNDSIHGYIEMHPLCVAIIDTEQFQRLRCIKQMGGTYFVYPGASHNRFEHSIGTSYLAGYFVESLRSKQKELEINDKDVLCVKIAGLCHDLGHGPFSHMFDNDFIPKVRHDKKWSHEDASKKMFDHLIKSNKNVEEMFNNVMLDLNEKGLNEKGLNEKGLDEKGLDEKGLDEKGLDEKGLNEKGLNEKDIKFIKGLMTGKTPTSEEKWKEVGREKKKRFLFEIVANKINGIDVDKWDYFARDCRYLGIKSSFDHMRCIQLARVITTPAEGLPQICFRDSAVGNIYDLFHTRLSIHKKACQHKTGNIIEMMITEALVKANDHLTFKGEKGETHMSTAIDDMDAYTGLTDHVYYQILYSSDVKLEKAREILQNIEKRNLYKFIGYTIPKDNPAKEGVPAMEKEIFNIVKEGEKKLEEETKLEEKTESEEETKLEEKTESEEETKLEEETESEEETELEEDDIIVQLTSFSYGGGMHDINPVDKVLFYGKDDEKKSFKMNKDQVSRMLPQVFFEKEIRVYCKKRDPETIRKMKEAFNQWCKHRGYQHKFYSYIEREEDKKPDEQLDQAEEPAVA